MQKNGKYSKRKAISLLSAIIFATLLLTALAVMLINRKFSDTETFKHIVSENYLLGVIIMVAVCAVQVILAFIPGELLEIASGYAFGAWAGALYCLIGITLGSVAAILLSRRFGRRFVEAFYPPENIDSLPILNNDKKRNIFVAILFLTPGTPKDLFTYIVGLTKMKVSTYILIASIARFPSIIMSTLSGGALGEESIIQAVIFFAVSALLSVTGYLIYHKVFHRKERNKKRTNNAR